MAIGGMIGGGIFSVLGVTVQLAGHYAYLREAGHPHFAAITSWYLVFG